MDCFHLDFGPADSCRQIYFAKFDFQYVMSLCFHAMNLQCFDEVCQQRCRVGTVSRRFGLVWSLSMEAGYLTFRRKASSPATTVVSRFHWTNLESDWFPRPTEM